MLNLFARLKEISAKLPLPGVSKPRQNESERAGSADKLQDAAPKSPVSPLGLPLRGRATSIDPVAKLYPAKSKETASFSSVEDSPVPSAGDLSKQNSDNKPATVAENLAKPTAPARPAPARQARQVIGAVGTTATAVGSSLVWAGKTVAQPFRGPKPLHKKRRFWLGSGLAVSALTLGGAWLFVDRSVEKYATADALTYVRPGTVTIKAVDGSILLQTGNATRETLKTWQMPDMVYGNR